jgi:ABC-type transport system involved in multi-copper enzyme maturation permease subunit
MKIRTLAWSTFGSFLHNRLIVVLVIVCVGVVLLMLTPLLGAKAMASAQNATQIQAWVLNMVSTIMGFVSGFGSLLAAWAAADCVGTEMTSGTILAVMARPVRRWEFLVGKFFGVMLLMSAYVLMTFGLSYLLAWMGGERIQSTPWILLVYPLVRYAIYAAVAMALVTLIRPIVTMGIVALLALGAAMVSSPNLTPHRVVLRQLVRGLYWILPSTNLLSESRFLEITHASLKQAGWLEHLTTIAYGLDYALVCLVLAMWSFHYRSLKRD